MKIRQDHLYHGAALTQIAEHPQFTAINSSSFDGEKSRSSYIINNDVGVLIKYASEPNESHNEYVFTFNDCHLAELRELNRRLPHVFIAFVCVKISEICAVSFQELDDILTARRTARGYVEEASNVLVTAKPGHSFRVYANAPGQKNTKLGEMIVPRNRFPECLFGS